jgi:hypothetical protein
MERRHRFVEQHRNFIYLNSQDTKEKPRYAGRAVVGRRVCEAFGKEERRGDGEFESRLGKTPKYRAFPVTT